MNYPVKDHVIVDPLFHEPVRFEPGDVMAYINATLIPLGYDIQVMDDGVLLDSIVAYPPSEDYQIFVFRSTFQNAWSSVYTVEVYDEMVPELEAFVQSVMNE